MQPKIIVNKNKQDRDSQIWEILKLSEIFSNNPDLFILEDEKIGIAQIKQLIKHLSTKPFGKTAKSAIILEGSNMSLDAQNSLLKILEEPPGDSIILIGVSTPQKLLPTILSRCLIFQPKSPLPEQENKSSINITQIINSSVQDRFAQVEKTENKERFLTDLTEIYRESVLKGEGDPAFLEDLLQARIWKENNVNIRTILEYLMLKLK